MATTCTSRSPPTSSPASPASSPEAAFGAWATIGAHAPPLLLPPPLLEARGPGPGPRRDQPDLLASGPPDLPPRHRRLRHPLPRVHDPPVLQRRLGPPGRRGGSGVRVAGGEELPGLFRQRRHPAPGRRALLGRRAALARPPLC